MGRGKASVDASSLTAGFAAAGIITRPGGAPMPKAPRSGESAESSASAVRDITGMDLAEGHLTERGYTILASNVRPGPGHPEIVARMDNTLVFFQVKTYVLGAAPWDTTKISDSKAVQLRAASEEWCKVNKPRFADVRYDAIGVIINTDGSRVRLNHLKASRFREFKRPGSP